VRVDALTFSGNEMGDMLELHPESTKPSITSCGFVTVGEAADRAEKDDWEEK
jgi:hypothetical protein